MDWLVTDASFKGFTFHVAIPNANVQMGVQSQEVLEERRLQISEKPAVDGAELEDFGAKHRTFNVTVIFFGPDYRPSLKKFREILNQGTAGTLILPDLDEAVQARYQRSGRTSTASDGSSTLMNITFLEDKAPVAKDAAQLEREASAGAKALVQAGKLADAQGSVQGICSKITQYANGVSGRLGQNSFLRAIAQAESAVVDITTAANSVANISRNARLQMTSLQNRLDLELDSLKGSVAGVLDFFKNLAENPDEASRYNLGLGAEDFAAPDIVSAAVIGGSSQVVVQSEPKGFVQSLPDASEQLKEALKNISSTTENLETTTQGNSADVSQSAIPLLNEISTLISVLEARPTIAVLTRVQTSIAEVCFQNGLDVAEVDRVHRLNPHLEDALDVPALTVVNL